MECFRDQFVRDVVLDGRFQTISPLNHGSFGMVFLAYDILMDRKVAIKCITKQSVPFEAGLDLAVDDKSEELSLHRSLGSHANIVNLLHSFETDAHVYLVMEFCSQGDLYEAIRNGHGPLQTEHVRQFMLQLVDAVAHAHSKGVYHRDIKPENIFLTRDGAMKLGDFGLATTDKWSFETTVGSDRYMAPEQFDSAGAGSSPAAADVWAIGICLLNILFSRNPFTTPTEADPLFLDYSRDKQSLFDVFPAMSQDTYEVIVQCMSLDPRKRSLVGAREALLGVVSFTMEDESLDDFCGAEKAIIASANREPLRTPSLQTPCVDAGAFPWAKALHASPQRYSRQLSVIPDESYSEDLFSKSGETADWCSASIQTPSMSSMLGSHLGASMQSFAAHHSARKARVSPTTESMPIAMSKPLTVSMSAVFGQRKDSVSKSWSDMWDEDEEEAREQQKSSFQVLNSRTWSHDSDEVPVKPRGGELELSSHNIKGDVDDDLVADGFFFQEVLAAEESPSSTPRYSPPTKRFNYDKWVALGERRRGQSAAEKSPISKPGRHVGLGHKSYEAGVWDHSFHNHYQNNQNNAIKFWPKDGPKECHWNKGRDWNWRRDRRTDLGGVVWVGGC
ncbi:Protein kinase-like domain protein [Ophiocordyceps sinensis CO18]|uniref:Autophagy-related protein 1 n=1 Tax=Ophiocordyceps sinensis (strain Co18 / CGMCC 3.14243) TaxID=911162 RepID=T5AKJ0_OPHSC|nr:Protein kinase-like domain protein [Ophiocordyceps sinensis CO18]